MAPSESMLFGDVQIPLVLAHGVERAGEQQPLGFILKGSCFSGEFLRQVPPIWG